MISKETKELAGWILILSGLVITSLILRVNARYWALALLPVLVGLMWTTGLFEKEKVQ